MPHLIPAVLLITCISSLAAFIMLLTRDGGPRPACQPLLVDEAREDMRIFEGRRPE